MPAAAMQAAPVLSTWDDDTGLEDLDLDQLVSQHRSKATPSSSREHSGGLGGSQSVSRPAAAAASALVRGAAQVQPSTAPAAHAPAQQMLATALPTQRLTQPGLAPASSAQQGPRYPAEASGLQGITERLLHLSNLIIDAQCEPQQMAVLHEERKHLLHIQQRLKAAAAGQPRQPAPTGSMQSGPQQDQYAAAASFGHQSSWPQQPNSGMHAGFDNQQLSESRQPSSAAFGQSNAWDQGAVAASMPGNPWEGENQGRQHSMQHAGSSGFAYDAPDTGNR